jgi:hypothetical protein
MCLRRDLGIPFRTISQPLRSPLGVGDDPFPSENGEATVTRPTLLDVGDGAKDVVRRVDLIGPPGVGKSSFCEHLIRNRQRGALWNTETELEKACALRLVQRQRLVWQRLGLVATARIPRLSKAASRHINRRMEREAFEWFADEFEGFVSLAKDAFCSSDKSEYRRAIGYHRFVSTMMRWAVLLRWAPSMTVLCDESIVQKMFGVLCWSQRGMALTKEYCRTMPRPSAVVCLVDAPTAIVGRIHGRQEEGGKTIPGHKGLSTKELLSVTQTMLDIVLAMEEALRGEGIPVLKLDASEEQTKNAGRVATFMQCVRRVPGVE